MKRPRAVGMSMLLLWSLTASMQEPAAAQECRQFMKVDTWKGTFTVKFKTSASQDPEGNYKVFSGSMDRSASGSFEVKRSETNEVLWEGDGTARINIDDKGVHGYPNWHYVTSSRASGESKLVGEDIFRPRVTINPLDCTYSIMLGDMRLPVRHSMTRSDSGETTTTTSDEHILVQITELRLPERGLVIRGRKELPVDTPTFLNIGSTGAGMTLWPTDKRPEGIVTWNLVPADVEEYVLEVELEGYDQWEPQASADQITPGNDITAVARLKTRDGKEPAQKAKQVLRKDRVQAMKEIDELLATQPRDVGGLSLKADLLLAEGKRGEALQLYNDALDAFYAQYPNAYEPPTLLLEKQHALLKEFFVEQTQ